MQKTVLFDLDGTLLDTLPDIRACVNDMLRSRGYPEIDEAQTRAYVGDGAKTLILRALPKGAPDLESAYEQFRTAFAACSNAYTRLYPDEAEVLSALRGQGWKLGVVTNKPQEAADRVIAQFFPAGLFDYVGGDSGAFPCKPDPAPVRYAMLRLHTPPACCVFVGDGETDARAAAAAGAFGVSVLWGYRTREQLAAAGAERFAVSYRDLQKILKNFSEKVAQNY